MRKPLTQRRWALLMLSGFVGSAAPSASADSPATARTQGHLSRYQSRLEEDTVRVLASEVSGTMKGTLAAESSALWACLSIAEWQRRLVAKAPALERATQVLARRSEVVWKEEQVTDEYASMILQMASVHAMQRGLVKVLGQLGVQTPEPVLPQGPTATPLSGSTRTLAIPVPMSIAPSPHRTRSAAPPAAVAAPPRSPVELRAMADALDRETYRILTPELEGSTLLAVAARKGELRSASTVAAWRAVLERANPSLSKAGAVLERRTEVLHEGAHVLDAYDSPVNQRSAVVGIETGLERILAQFGK